MRISNSRFSSTEVYKSVYFSDFISHGSRHDILNKVIINGMTGCSWRFNRLITLTVKVLNLDREIAKIIMAQFIGFEVVQKKLKMMKTRFVAIIL